MARPWKWIRPGPLWSLIGAPCRTSIFIVPVAAILPSNNPQLSPAGIGSARWAWRHRNRNQISLGPWTTYGGGGATLFNHVEGYRNFPFAGGLLQRDIGKELTLGGEFFYHGPEGLATPQTNSATLLDFGGYYKFRDPAFQLLSCYGHTIVGQSENYGYLGLYWTWGKQNDKKDTDAASARLDSHGWGRL